VVVPWINQGAKKAIRQEIIKRRAALDPLEREQNSFAAARRLLSLVQVPRSENSTFIAGVRSEIDTRFLPQESLRLGKCVAMPRCDTEKPGTVGYWKLSLGKI